MSGECGYDGWRNGTAFCACSGRFDSVQDFERHIGTPTPVPSEVAETTAGEREVEALAYLFGEHASIGSDERKIGDEWVWGFDCECGEFTPDTEVNEHLARAVLASPALAALLDRVRREEGERIAQAIEAKYLGPDSGRGYDGSEAPDAHCRNAYDEGLYDAAAIVRAASVGRGEG